MGDKIKYTSYLIGAIEHATAEETICWREDIRKALNTPPTLVFYDPTLQEKIKTGKESRQQCEYIAGLKRAGHWDIFMEEMEKIWLGHIKSQYDLIEIFKTLRYRKLIDGNEERDFAFFGDFEAVIRSDFVIAYLPKDINTVGSLIEIFLAMLLKIPVYLIIDVPKTECNSTLLWMILYSNGMIFYNIKDCITFIKEKYLKSK